MDSKEVVLQLLGVVVMFTVIYAVLFTLSFGVTEGEYGWRVVLFPLVLTIAIMLILHFCNMWWMALPDHPLPR